MAAAQFTEDSRLCSDSSSQPLAKALKSILKQEISFLYYYFYWKSINWWMMC